MSLLTDSRIKDLGDKVNNKRIILAEERWNDFCSDVPANWDRGTLAQILENQATHFASLDEATMTANVGSFEKFIFPMIRTVWPNLVSTELVSVQAMDGPISMIFFLDFTAGSTKGGITKGDTLISSRTGMQEAGYDYVSEQVTNEAHTPAGGNGSTTDFVTLGQLPVRPGSVSVYNASTGALVATDNGAGGFTSGTGTINYTTGVIVSGNTFTSIAYTYNYDWNSEMSDVIPQMDASLTSTPVQSRPYKVRARWSVEVAAQLKAVQGLDAEVELTEALAQQIRFGIDNRIINDLFAIAGAGNVTFDANPPAGSNIAYFTHQMSLVKVLASGSNKIFKATRRGYANWIVAGVDAATIMESHPLFESSGNLQGPGVVFSGVLAGRWKVFKNPYLADSSKFLLGYKGQNFFDAGYVYAPWIPFYATPTITLDDMMFRKAVMTHYGRKAVNGLFFALGQVLNA